MKRVDATTYRDGDFRIERMEDGRWDAYLPGELPGSRLWQSPAHPTRRGAEDAVVMKRRRCQTTTTKLGEMPR